MNATIMLEKDVPLTSCSKCGKNCLLDGCSASVTIQQVKVGFCSMKCFKDFWIKRVEDNKMVSLIFNG